MSYGEFGELIMKLSRAALRPLLAAHERGAWPLVGAAWGVTVRKSSHNASNARGVTAGKIRLMHESAIGGHDQWLPRCRSNIGIGNEIVGSFLLVLNPMALYAIWNVLCNLISE